MRFSKNVIARALQLETFDGLAAQKKMMPVPRPTHREPAKPGQAREGAVLVLLYDREGQVHFVLTRRRDHLGSHAGQISLPGGRREVGEALHETALRETFEEVGVQPSGITILGELTPLYIAPSDFEVHPFVGWSAETPAFMPHDEEVAEIIEVPLDLLFDASILEAELWERRGIQLEVPFYHIGPHKVWGATAMMLSEFSERLRFKAENCVTSH